MSMARIASPISPRRLLLLGTDVLILFIAFFLTLLLGHREHLAALWHLQYQKNSITWAILGFLSFVVVDFYNLNITGKLWYWLPLSLASVLGATFAYVIESFFFRPLILPRAVVFLLPFIAASLIFVWRYTFMKLLQNNMGGPRLAIMGVGRRARQFAGEISHLGHWRLQLAGYLQENENKSVQELTCGLWPEQGEEFKVLVVAKRGDWGAALKEAADHCGARCSLVASLDEALKILDTEIYSVVILGQPLIGWKKFVRHARRQSPWRLIIYAGSGDRTSAPTGMELGDMGNELRVKNLQCRNLSAANLEKSLRAALQARESHPILGTVRQLSEGKIQARIDMVVVADEKPLSDGQIQQLLDCIRMGAMVYSEEIFHEVLFERVNIGRLNDRWFLETLQSRDHHFFWLAKRSLDILLCLVGLAIAVPLLFPLIMAGICVTSPGNVFYSQERVGRKGKTFLLYKFRTMQADAEALSGAVWSASHDPRVTAFGAFLRRTRLDELPQLWNVLKGDMSLVGPRPERPEIASMLSKKIKFYDERHSVAPGLSGWAQINHPYGNTVQDARHKLEYDLYYIKYRNPVLEVQIVLRTLATVLRGAGH